MSTKNKTSVETASDSPVAHQRMVMWRQAQVTLLVKLPGEMSPTAIPLTISDRIAECMRPLPRNREIPWEFRDRQQAEEMMTERHRLAKEIAENLTGRLLEHFKGKDPVNGYSPEEWATPQPHNDKSSHSRE